MERIYEWKDISSDFSDGLLLGNGASIAVSKNFSYRSLYDFAINREIVEDETKDIFEAFGSNDFEYVLRKLWAAKKVNSSLKIPCNEIDLAYTNLRKALIDTVYACHIKYSDIKDQLEVIYNFMHSFKTVVSLNYDLIVYWACMNGNDNLGRHFKDCFTAAGPSFSEDWEKYKTPYIAKGATLVFYLHGNLVLASNKKDGQEVKILANESSDLLKKVADNWSMETMSPLFVSEGNTSQKLESIYSSRYLTTVYTEVLPSIKESLVIYGWSFGANDEHILKKLREAVKSGLKNVAVSVFNKDEDLMAVATKKLRQVGVARIVFFDSKSSGCWNNPLKKPVDVNPSWCATH